MAIFLLIVFMAELGKFNAPPAPRSTSPATFGASEVGSAIPGPVNVRIFRLLPSIAGHLRLERR